MLKVEDVRAAVQRDEPPAPASTSATERSAPEPTRADEAPTQAIDRATVDPAPAAQAEREPAGAIAEAPPSSVSATASSGSDPKLADGIELVGEFEGSGYKETPYIARREDGQVIQLTYLLFLVAERCDGSRDLAAIAEGVSEGFGRQVSAKNVAFLVEKKLRPLGVLALPDGSSPDVKKADPLLALKFKTKLLPEKAVQVVASLLRPLFWPPVILAVLAGLVAVDIWYFSVHGIGQSLRDTIYQPGVILIIYALLVVSIAWHELGHATGCRYGGATPGVIGFGIYVVWPAFYNDVTDAYRLGKGGRVRTDLGGIYFNMIFAIATAGLYFLTRFEPLLVVILMQHLLMVYQFMPFLRLDGYYVISDLTGVPDLFSRVKPTLRSLPPWKENEPAVEELKPWVRVVVTLWVISVIPVLLYLFTMMAISAPRVLATGYDSLLIQSDKVGEASGNGEYLKAVSSGAQMAMLVLPLLGMSVTLARVAKRIAVGAVNITQGRPLARTALAGIGAAAVILAGFILIPNGEYRPIQEGEDFTLADSFDALGDVVGGRPSLTEERAEELGGAPSVHDGGGAPQPGVTPAPTTGTEDEQDPDEQDPDGGSDPTPEPDTTAAEEVTPEAEPTTTP